MVLVLARAVAWVIDIKSNLLSKPTVGALNELFWVPLCNFLFFGRNGKLTGGFILLVLDKLLSTTVVHSRYDAVSW
jgi:hypothetical protein